MKCYGEKLLNVHYVERFGAYGLSLNKRRQIPIVSLPQGNFLLGGGIKAGETAVQALRREILEESGHNSVIGDQIFEAGQYYYSDHHERYSLKKGQFFQVNLSEHPIQSPINSDHKLVWLDCRKCLEFLSLEYQKEAVRYFFEHLTAKLITK